MLMRSAVDRVGSGGAVAGHVTSMWLPAIVVFADDVCLKWLRPLRSGFRHCFVAVNRSDVWIISNSLSHYTDLDVAVDWTAAEISAWYHRLGCVTVETTTRTPVPRCAPIRPFTCVESVKRILGLRAPWVLTPWQLYRHLTRVHHAPIWKKELNLDIAAKIGNIPQIGRPPCAYRPPSSDVTDQEESPMGGLFKTPNAQPVQTAPVVTPIADPIATNTASKPEESAQQQRVDSLKRQARGRAATISTSPRGLLTLSSTELTRKSLLGE